MLEIVKMNEGHIKEIAELEKACFSDPWSENMLRSELKSNIAHYFVAENDGEPIGYIGMYITVDTANITNEAVKEEYRRMKVAQKLLSKLIEKSREENLDFITLEVRKSNSPAISLYQKFGFIIEGVRKAYYSDNNEDAYIMTKSLNE